MLLAQDLRPARCIGAALSIALSILEKTVGKSGARLMLFTGGPATSGPGQVVERPLVNTMRSHIDLTKGNVSTDPGATLLDHVTKGE
jgi:protein transport protein SEC23